VESQVWVTKPLHCFEPGLHVPEQAPPLHTLVQTVPFCQKPSASHVCGARLLHCFVPGVQLPVHTPATQAWLTHEISVPHCPLAPHV
jgi:hypothetical protein